MSEYEDFGYDPYDYVDERFDDDFYDEEDNSATDSDDAYNMAEDAAMESSLFGDC